MGVETPSSEVIGQRMEAGLAFLEAYFMTESKVHHAAEELTQRLGEAGIDYAIAGALSLNAHGFNRATEDVDIVITREGLAKFKAAWLGRGYVNVHPGGKPVRDTINNVRIDFLLTGDFPGDGNPKPVVIPEPAKVAVLAGRYRVVSLPSLIELKLASGMTAPHRLKDLSDVVQLIRSAQIPMGFTEELNPYVREKFGEMWALAQHPDEDY